MPPVLREGDLSASEEKRATGIARREQVVAVCCKAASVSLTPKRAKATHRDAIPQEKRRVLRAQPLLEQQQPYGVERYPYKRKCSRYAAGRDTNECEADEEGRCCGHHDEGGTRGGGRVAVREGGGDVGREGEDGGEDKDLQKR